MDGIDELIRDLRAAQIRIWAEDGALRYSAPAGALTAPLRARLTHQKADLIALLARRAGDANGLDETGALPQIDPDVEARHEPFPLTDVQQAYWVGRSQDFELGNVATHAYFESELYGVDPARCSEVWRKLVQRHGMLRAIVLPDGTQRVLEDVPDYEIAFEDLRGLDSEAQSKRLQEARREMSHQVFQPDRWPLFEVRAFKLVDRWTRLCFSYDLLIGDGWSFRILERDFYLLYRNREQEIEPLRLTFRDYVLAEKRLESGPAYREAERYWRERLPGFPDPPQLPQARRGATASSRFKRRSLRIAPKTWRRIKDRAKPFGLTSAGLLLAVYAETLRRWSKSERFAINLTLFKRLPLHDQVESIVGDFTTLSLLEVDSAGKATFLDRARALQSRLWQDIQRSLYSGVRAQRELMRLNGGKFVLFPVVFTSNLGLDSEVNYEEIWEGVIERQDQEEEGLFASKSDETATEAYGISQTSQVWLDNQVTEINGNLWCVWDAMEDVFPAGLLDAMFEAQAQLLKDLSADASIWSEASPLSLPAAQAAARSRANATAAALPDAPLHALFSEKALEAPERVAVVTPRERITYGQLHALADRIGAQLRELGAGPNQLVAVAMEKGWEQVAAVLGILRAGAAYLPLAHDLPPERLRYLLADAEATVVLTQARLAGQLSLPASVRKIAVDPAPERAGDLSPWASAQRMEDLAYVIYTSGSTGKPKGVMIDHLGAVNTILDVNRRFGIGSEDRVLALSSLSFDLSVYDIFGTLAAGGAIVMPDEARRRDPSHWVELMRENGVTVWNSVPALMQMLLDYCEGVGRALPNALRLAMLSGDWIPLGLPEQARAFNQALEIISLGGATEASIWSIFHRIGEVDRSWKSIPYGMPLANQTFYALNPQGEDCPDLAPGELCIGGVGLAKGYWKDKEKTAASFVAHPKTGERLYRTGDWGRYLPDGEIEFLGRQDSQVKVGGHRIELGEIEAALNEHPRVKESIVCAPGDRDQRRLVAYVIRESAPAAPSPRRFDPAELKSNPLEKLRFKRSRPALRLDGEGLAARLPTPSADSAFLEKFVSRRSYRDFRGGTIPLEAFSTLLAALMQIDVEGIPLPKARYASAGSLYPIQFYFYIRPGKIEGLKGGIHYYNPREHTLVALADEESRFAPALDLECAKFNPNAAFALFMIAKMDAIRPLYPDSAETFCMLEAGMATQLIETVAPEQNIGVCQLGGYSIDAIREAFALDDDHRFAHCLIGGAILPEQRSLGALRKDARPDMELLEALAESGGAPRAQPSEPAAEIEYLRRSLGSKLPAYMVPKTFVFMEKFPLSGNGKVDRNALPVPSETAPVAQRSDRRAPNQRRASPEVESVVLGVWREVLGIEDIGLEDNFFDLGGTSVHVIRAHAKLKERFDREIPIVDMFAKTTVSALVEMLDSQIEQPPQEQRFSDVFDRARRQRAALRK